MRKNYRGIFVERHTDMKKIIIALSIILILLIIYLIGLSALENIRMPIKGNVILDYNNINITNINISADNIHIDGQINNERLSSYIINNVDTQIKDDTLFISIYGGYGVGDDAKKFTVDEPITNSSVKKVILNGNSRKDNYIIWK